MESKVNYTVVGIFVLLLGLALVAGFVWLSQEKHNAVYEDYLVYLHEEVSGLSEQSPVRYNGVPVGLVKSIRLDERNPQLVRILLSIEKGTPITTSTVATLRTQGITGINFIGLSSETIDAPHLERHPGEQYPVIPAKPSILLELSEVLPRITKKITTLSESITKLLNDKNQKSVQESLEHIAIFTKTLSDNSENLKVSLKSLRTLLSNSAEASKDLPKTLKKLDTSLSAIHQAASRVSVAATQTNKMMQDTRVAVNGVSQQLLPSAQQTLVRLNAIAQNLQHLSEQVAKNPAVILRGSRETSLGPGE